MNTWYPVKIRPDLFRGRSSIQQTKNAFVHGDDGDALSQQTRFKGDGGTGQGF